MPLGDIFHYSVLLAHQLGLREVACLVSSLRVHQSQAKAQPRVSASPLLGGAVDSLAC